MTRTLRRKIIGAWLAAECLLLTARPAALAQSYDGTYTGTIFCEPIPGVTTKPLQTPFTLRIAGEKIDYEREVLRPDEKTPLGVTEKGAGKLGADGELVLSGAAAGRTFRGDAKYQGKFSADSIRLTGTQVWTYSDKPAPFHRSCTIELKRSR